MELQHCVGARNVTYVTLLLSGFGTLRSNIRAVGTLASITPVRVLIDSEGMCQICRTDCTAKVSSKIDEDSINGGRVRVKNDIM